MAKEQFRDKDFKGNIKVKYTDGTGKTNYWETAQEGLLESVLGIVSEYTKQRIILTNRQLYYQLVAAGLIPNAVEIYKRLCAFLTDARYAGLIDWKAIEDRGRVPHRNSEWDNVKELVDTAVKAYRLPRWDGQDYYVELFCEKQAMESVFEPVAKQYHITFGTNKGYSSASTMYELAKRIHEQIDLGKSAVILYFGDHDPSGLDMVRDIRERITEFLTKGSNPLDEMDIDDLFRVEHLALKYQQVQQFRPPPNPAKVTDPRAKGYIAEYGRTSWELDALKPEVLIDLAQTGILGFLDFDKYNDVCKKEQEDIQALRDFAGTLVA